MWVDNVGRINSFICCSGAPYQKRADGATTSIKAKPNVRNISTQHFNATSYNIARSRCGMLWRSWPNACNILQPPKMLLHCKSLIQHHPTSWTFFNRVAKREPNVCNMVIYKTEKNWWRRLRSSAALSSHLTTMHTTMHIISKSQYGLTIVQLNNFLF